MYVRLSVTIGIFHISMLIFLYFEDYIFLYTHTAGTLYFVYIFLVFSLPGLRLTGSGEQWKITAETLFLVNCRPV